MPPYQPWNFFVISSFVSQLILLEFESTLSQTIHSTRSPKTGMYIHTSKGLPETPSRVRQLLHERRRARLKLRMDVLRLGKKGNHIRCTLHRNQVLFSI